MLSTWFVVLGNRFGGGGRKGLSKIGSGDDSSTSRLLGLKLGPYSPLKSSIWK